ncbi:GTPase [Macrococcus lamae]|uniref:GTP-binding protein n=1 Tax=Macrococcus lamae TaxID=198484 RepID=A0A4V3BF44_9STAP|nr:GTPase [Macrococcus lamae]TDM12293.1 GTP-binding protein [Macrococcus lamae]
MEETMNNKDFDSAFEDIFKNESSKINEQLSKQIMIALVGDVNSGKSSTINKLMQEDIAAVGAKPGETIAIKEIPYMEHILFVDTPGLDDVNATNSKVTLDYYKKADVILFFLNAAGTVLSENELKNLMEIGKTNKDIIIVLNKIDAADDVPEQVKYIEDKTSNKYLIAPISSRTGENITMLQNHLLDILKKKSKDLLMGKHMKNKSKIADKWILGAGVSAAAVGALPVPGSDFIPLTSIQIGMMLKLANLYNKPLSKENARELIIATIVGNAGKAAFRQLVKLVPGAGSAIGASIAGAATVSLGYAMKYMYEHNIEITDQQLKIIYDKFLKEQKKDRP